MRAQDLLAKAIRAAASAKVLLDTGDADGACNRAYDAMYDAARAALLASRRSSRTRGCQDAQRSDFSLQLALGQGGPCVGAAWQNRSNRICIPAIHVIHCSH